MRLMGILLACGALLHCGNSLQSEEALVKSIHESISSSPFVISAEKAKKLMQQHGIQEQELLDLLMVIAKSYAQPPISNYYVGAALLGESGTVYLGVNLEFPGHPLHETVHGEQFAVVNGWHHGETSFQAIALSAAPCGHCRQFMNEIKGSNALKIWVSNRPSQSLSALLPHSFGPQDLNIEGDLLTTSVPLATPITESSLLLEAFTAASHAYAPYTQAQSGVAIRTKDGNIYTGSYLENAAFNPSLSPLQAALISLVVNLHEYSEIDEVVLVEKKDAKISQEVSTREILKTIAPEAIFHVEKI